MRTRNWGIFIAINVVLSATVVLIVLFLWGKANTPTPPPSIPAPTPTLAIVAEATHTPTASPVASPTPLPPLLYTVQAGDTLGAIAQTYDVSVEELMDINDLTDPNKLSIGQTLIIPVYFTPTPGAEPTSQAPPAPSSPTTAPPRLPTLTPSGPPLVEIGQVLGAGSLANEVVIVRNRGGWADLEGWTISDAQGNTFVFPALTLFTDAETRIHTTAGKNTPSDLYWGRSASAWNSGELITLADATGAVVNTYIAP